MNRHRRQPANSTKTIHMTVAQGDCTCGLRVAQRIDAEPPDSIECPSCGDTVSDLYVSVATLEAKT